MTDVSVPNSLAAGGFRVGSVLNRAASVLSRHFLIFMVVSVTANLPLILVWSHTEPVARAMGRAFGRALPPVAGYDILIFSVGAVGFFLLNTVLSQALIVHAAFRAMSARPINISVSLTVGLTRFIPILLLSLLMGIFVFAGSVVLFVPALVLMTVWFVGTQACIVERLGPWSSLERSAELTKGNRWKVFGLLALIYVVGFFVSYVISLLLAIAPVGDVALRVLDFILNLLANGLWGAYYTIAAVIAYHDLRVSKEGHIDTEHIAAVFD
jgi:hypothetical protein